MSGFENLPQAIDEGLAQRPMTPEEVAFDAEKLEEQAALGLVVRDAELAKAFVTSKGHQSEWDRMDNLYRAQVPIKKWPGSDVTRANLSMPLVLEVIEGLLPQIHMAFFSDRQPFLLLKRGKTSDAAAAATAKVVNWALVESGFKEEIRKILKSCLHRGQGVGKWGWSAEVKPVRKYRRNEKDQSIESTTSDSESFCPTFEYVDLKNVLVDPATRNDDIRTAGYVIFQKYVDANELDALRDVYEKIPSQKDLKVILANNGEPTQDSLSGIKTETFRENSAEKQDVATSTDPLSQPLELLEYWTPSKVITVLQRKIVIRNEENEFGKIPFVSCAFIDVLNSFYGFGVGKLVEGDQRLQSGVMNAFLDQLHMYLQPPMKRSANSTGAPTLQTELTGPGKVLRDGLEPVSMQPPAVEALNVVALADARAHRRVGANSGQDMPTQAMRTAEGVQAFQSGVQTRLQYFVEQFADKVFIPTLEAFIEMCKEHMTPDQINAILSEEEGKEYEGDVLDFYNASCKFEVLTSTKLAGRRAMAQMVPMYMQMWASDPVQQSLTQQGKKVDYVQFVRHTMDIAGMNDFNFIVEMTPEDQQRSMMMNPAVIKAQTDQQMQAQKHQNTLEQIDAQTDGKVAKSVIDHAMKASEPKEEPGKPLAIKGSKKSE